MSEYTHLTVNHEQLVDRGQSRDVVEFLDFPESHKAYRNTWVGMDMGKSTLHPLPGSALYVTPLEPTSLDRSTSLSPRADQADSSSSAGVPAMTAKHSHRYYKVLSTANTFRLP